MNYDDEEDIPILLDTSVNHDVGGDSGPDVAKSNDIRVPLTIVTGNLADPKSAGPYLISNHRLSWSWKNYLGELHST